MVIMVFKGLMRMKKDELMSGCVGGYVLLCVTISNLLFEGYQFFQTHEYKFYKDEQFFLSK